MKPIEPITSKSWPLILSSLGIEEKVEEKHYSRAGRGSIIERITLSDEDSRKMSVLYRDRDVIGRNIVGVINNDLYTLDEQIKILTKFHQIRTEFNLLSKNNETINI